MDHVWYYVTDDPNGFGVLRCTYEPFTISRWNYAEKEWKRSEFLEREMYPGSSVSMDYDMATEEQALEFIRLATPRWEAIHNAKK